MVIYKTIKTYKGIYFYDRDCNKIVPICKEEYLLLNKYGGNAEYIKNDLTLKKYTEAGFLQENAIKEIRHQDTDYIEYYVNGQTKQMTLQITQDCNLRCDYCVYSGKFDNRCHSHKRMDFLVAQKSIDYLYLHSNKLDEVIIGFYGGEPLLEYKLIKEIIGYARKKFIHKNIQFVITTNGTLLTLDKVEFLKQNNVKVTISLDGPQHIHDRSRVFESGEGSYSIIRKNIEEILKHFPDFKRNISFNVVLDPTNNYEDVIDYFENDKMYKGISVLINSMDVSGLPDRENALDNFVIQKNYEHTYFLLALLDKIKVEKNIRTFEYMKTNIMGIHNNLSHSRIMSGKAHPSGPCIPGVRRLFVTTEGKLYPCERVPEDNIVCLGDLESGINIEKAKQIINLGYLLTEDCKNCWALNHCTICVRDIIERGKYSIEKKKEKCRLNRKRILEEFVEICLLYELGYNFEGDST